MIMTFNELCRLQIFWEGFKETATSVNTHKIYFSAAAREGVQAPHSQQLWRKKCFDLILIFGIRVHVINSLKYMLLVVLNFKNENLKNFLRNLPHASLSAILDFIRTSDTCTKALVLARPIGLLNNFCSTTTLSLKKCLLI